MSNRRKEACGLIIIKKEATFTINITVKNKIKTDIKINKDRDYAYFTVTGNIKGVKQTVKVLIDIEDVYVVERGSWSLLPTNQNKFYLKSKSYITNKNILLHNLVIGKHDNPVDHINRKPNDNRKKNLRIVSPRDNSRNTSLYDNNKTGFKGISIRYDNPESSRYIASVTEYGKVYSKSFSIQKYGEKEALRLAKLWRKLNNK